MSVQEAFKKYPRTTISFLPQTREKLKALKKELGFRTYDALLNYFALEISKGEIIAPADYSIIFEKFGSRPVIITGESGSGKTTTVKELLSHWSGNVFMLDVSNEYSDLKRFDLGRFFSLDWEKENQRVRFVPNSNVEISKAEAATVFSHLNFVKNSMAVKNWVISIEEAHRFSSDANLRALLIEARKFTRKIILITTDWRVYQGIAPVFRPRPWQVEAVPSETPVQQVP